jgi:hypothetical protein
VALVRGSRHECFYFQANLPLIRNRYPDLPRLEQYDPLRTL